MKTRSPDTLFFCFFSPRYELHSKGGFNSFPDRLFEIAAYFAHERTFDNFLLLHIIL